MKHFTTLNLVLLIVVWISPFHSQGQTSSAEEKILLDIERQRSEAIANGNSGALSAIYQDQFRGVTETGVAVDKKNLMENFKSVPAGLAFTVEDLKAAIYGYAGVTSGKLVAKNKDGTIISQSRFMHVFVKRNGKWMIVESQDGPIVP